jgi:hypothetical protein
MVGVATRQELQTLLGQDVRKVLITTIFKFDEADGKAGDPTPSLCRSENTDRAPSAQLLKRAVRRFYGFGGVFLAVCRRDVEPAVRQDVEKSILDPASCSGKAPGSSCKSSYFNFSYYYWSVRAKWSRATNSETGCGRRTPLSISTGA